MHDIRQLSKKDEYHVIINFIEELHVFSQDDEKEFLIKILEEKNNKNGCKILSHVEMLNHAHMIIKVPNLKALASLMISINTKFAKFYNRLHNRRGRVFSKRYTSLPINDERYLFSCFRYQGRNPVVIQAAKTPWDYKWSSSKDYLERKGSFYHEEIIVRFNKYYEGAIFSFEEFMGDPIEDNCIFDINKKLYYDSIAKKIYDDELGQAGISRLDPVDKPYTTSHVVNRLRKIGLTYIQLKEFSGISILKIKDSEQII